MAMAAKASVTTGQAISGGNGLLSLETVQKAASHRRVNVRYKRMRMLVRASSADADFGAGPEYVPGIVDANMVVLRKRIHRLRMQESIQGMPEQWMDWEKSCYSTYQADVCLMLESLQSHLLMMRPSVALSLFSVAVSVLPVVGILFIRLLAHSFMQ